MLTSGPGSAGSVGASTGGSPERCLILASLASACSLVFIFAASRSCWSCLRTCSVREGRGSTGSIPSVLVLVGQNGDCCRGRFASRFL